jgi:hypothetical protein
VPFTFVRANFAQIYNRYFVSPYTYITEGLLSQGAVAFPSTRTSTYRSFSALAHFQIVCSSTELVTLIPPAGQTCGAYLQNYINRVGGYVQDPSATSSCQFCSFATTDQLLSTNFHMFYSHRWRNVGFLVGYTFVNVRFMYLLMNIHVEVHFLPDCVDLCPNVCVPHSDWEPLWLLEKAVWPEELLSDS